MTGAQAKLLAFITGYIAAHDGVPPLFDEMKNHMGLHSKSGIGRMVDALQRQNKIRRVHHAVRGIELVDPPLAIDPGTDAVLASYCRVTSAIPRLIVAEALAEYFAKRRFVA